MTLLSLYIFYFILEITFFIGKLWKMYLKVNFHDLFFVNVTFKKVELRKKTLTT